MTTIQQLISQLYTADIKLALRDGKLQVNAPQGALTPTLRAELSAHKAELLTFLAQQQTSQPIPQRTDQSPAPLSFAQQRLWFLEQLGTTGTTYHLVTLLQLTGDLQIALLEASLSAIVARHAILRTTYTTVDGEPQQTINAPQPVTLETIDLRTSPPDAQMDEVKQVTAALQAKPFDLAQGPLWRFQLFRLSPTASAQNATGADERSAAGQPRWMMAIVMHHLITDEWSTSVLVQEVSAFYHSMITGDEAMLPTLPIQYADYATWQRAQAETATWQRQLDQMIAHLRDATPLLQLPTDHERPAAPSLAAAAHSFSLPATLSAQLKAFAQANNSTLYTLYLTAFALLLSRYSRQHDFIVGSPVANRERQELEPLIGFLVNTLALRMEIDPNHSFRTLLRKTRQQVLDAFANINIPFEQLVDALQPVRQLNHNPLFQVMFVWQHGLRETLELPGLAVDLVAAPPTNIPVDLLLTMHEDAHADGGAIRGQMLYSTDLFRETTAVTLVDHLLQLLANVVAQPDAPLHTLPCLTPTTRAAVLTAGTGIPQSTPPDQPLHALVEAQVARTPDAPAIYYQAEAMSYAKLNARANQLAHALLAEGHGSGHRIAICAERSPDMIIAVLAVMKIGAAYVPLDPDYPAERLAYMLKDAAVAAILAQTAVANCLPLDDVEVRVPTFWLDRFDCRSFPTTNPEQPVEPTAQLYQIYTSGSTGHPKGVVVSHRGVANTIGAIADQIAIGPGDRLFQFVPFGFDPAAIDFFATLSRGAALVLHPQPTRLSADELLAFCSANGVTIVNFTVALWQQWVDNLHLQGRTFPSALRVFLTGGDKPGAQTLRTWATLGDHTMLYCCSYGPTEASITTTFYTITNEQVRREPPPFIPLGPALPNVAIYLLDEHQQLVPPGTPGEIYIGGAGVADGYWQRPDLTADRFVELPAFDNPTTTLRLYRTGDLARWRFAADGTSLSAEFIGRVDTQVKIRGFRIELGEIETQLRRLPSVREAVVIATESMTGHGAAEKQLAAYVQMVEQPAAPQLSSSDDAVTGEPHRSSPRVPWYHPPEQDDERISGRGGGWEGVISQLRVHLPLHMIPTAWTHMDAWPMTPNGKIDRAALPTPDFTTATESYVAPTSPLEAEIAAIWARLLGRERVGITSDFFAIGGHSLLATQVVAHIQQQLNRQVPLRTLFEAPTIAQLAAAITDTAHVDTRPPLVSVDRAMPLPLSFAQQRLWLLHQLHPESSGYNIPAALQLTGTLHVAALQQALDALVARHESLRTTFVTINGEPMQQIAATGSLPLHHVDLRHLPNDERPPAAEAQAAILAQEPFDLATDPLVRAYLFTLTDDSAILFVLMHHIITDGWSIPILVAELSAYYSAAVVQRAPTVAPLPLQYADYAHWQRQWLRDGVLQDQLTYWRQQLAGAPTLLALPTDRPRPAQPTFAAGTLTFAIDPATVAALRALAQQHGATLFMAFAATLGVLLSRYSQQRDLLIGTPIANRTHPALDKLIGFFVNTLALRFDLSEPLSFAALLDQVRQTTLDAYAHQDAPFDQVIDTLALPRDLSHAPLFQVLLAWQSATGNGQDVDLPGLSLAPVAWHKPTLEVDLALSVAEEEVQGAEAEGATELAVTWQYSTDLFERERMAEMVASFQTLLSAVVSTPAEPVASLPLYPAATLSRLLAAGVGPVQPEITAHCLHHQFEAVVAAQPQAPALLFSHHAISYAELNARANQLAHALAAHGYGPGDRIAICLERSPQLVIAILAVLKCGAAYLPLDPAYPHDRLSYILQDAAAATLITTHLLATERFTVSETAAAAPNMLLLDALDVSTFPIANPTVTVTPSAPFYQIYTSGSTGQPKGVLVAHQGVANTITATVTQAEIRVGDRLLQFVPVGFDAAAIDLFAPLTTGGVIVIHPHPTRLAAHELLAFCRQEGVTVLNQSTAAWQQLVNNMVVQGLRFPPTVRVFLTGGEKPAVAALHTWATLGDHPMRYVSSYGPTEASISASIYTITSDEVRATSPSLIPLGEPLPNVSLLLLDAAQQPVPDGAPGEIYIGGIGVHNEYWQRPTQTAAGYVELPWVTTAAGQQMERYYRTGDLARRRQTPAGTLFEFVGRVDTQVKIRGFRIELGEIETQINQLPQVRTAIVLAQEHGTADKRLVAYVQLATPSGDASTAQPADPRPATGDEAAALAAQLREQLPEHMIPTAWLIMATWPLTAHGKVDRNALPAPTFAFPAETYVAPQGPLESVLAAIWQEVLGLEQVGVTTNFFALGGHSLLATQVVARIQQQLEVAVPLRTLFAQPTIRQLAGVVAAAQPAANRPPIVRIDRDAPLSLSFAQQRLWLMQQLTPDSGFFNMPAALRLTGELRLDALQAAFDGMLARHESLRTYFPQVNGTPMQQIGASTISIAHYPHSHPPTGDAAEWSEAKLIAWVTELAEAPFDLETGPLLRVALLRLHANQHLLLIVMHHIIGDDWSRRIFMQEFSELYRAQITGEAADLPALMIQYADFAAWQRQWLQGDLLQQQLDYWRTQLAAAPPLLELPTDHPRPPQQRFVGERLTVTLNAALSAALRTFSREQQSTLHMTLLTGFAALLARYSGMDDLVIGIPVAGRTDQPLEGLIGFFLNTLALRIRLSTELDFTALLAQVRQVTLDAYANQDAPFERVIEVVNPTPQLSHTPIFQVMFDLAQADEHDLELPGLHVEALEFDTSSAKFDLHLVFSESADEQAGLTAVWGYNSDIFARSTIEQMARHLEQLYRVALQAPTRPLTQLPLLTAAERGVALQRWNQTAHPIPADACMQELFEAQVARTPHARAARCGEETLTYVELNARANRWAKQLVALGVGPDVIVTPFWARDLDYLTAILAIFKAGGAYQPLDPALPSKRLTQILEQSRSPLILTKRAFLPLVESALAALPTAQRPQCMLVDDLDAVTLPVDNLPRRNQPDNLAYVIFTSGSTGVPKGVMVEQRGLVNHLCAMQHNLGLNTTDIIGQSATQSYVISVWQFLAALTVGATVEIIPAETMLDPVALLDTLEAREVSVVQVVPSLLRLLLEALEMYRVPSSPTSDAKLHGGPCANGMNDPQPLPLSADASAQQQLPNVRWMIPTGEALPPALARRWFAVCPHIPLLNAYGSSECSDDVAHDRITQPPAENVVTMPIGQPIPNVQMYVLDANLEPVPVGVAGELYVGGLGVGRGYLHDAARTARSFLPNPFQPDPTARLYKTGDRVRRLADGTVEYLGRFDFQVKVRGVRIELGEIEATLGHHPAVAQTVVMVHGKEGAHDVGQTQVVAYVVPKRAATVTPSQLRQFLAEQLPDYMVPAAILLLPDFPRNASGKVARALLPSPTQLLTGDSQPYIAPRNDIEVEIVDILAEVTGIDAKTIGVHHNFFDLGGHSMQAIQIVWQLHDRFGVELPLRSIFEQTTVESLANLVIDGQLAQIDDETIEALLAEVEHAA